MNALSRMFQGSIEIVPCMYRTYLLAQQKEGIITLQRDPLGRLPLLIKL